MSNNGDSASARGKAGTEPPAAKGQPASEATLNVAPVSGSENSSSKPGKRKSGGRGFNRGRRPRHTFAALDLGTNNCRLLVATPRGKNFRIIDAFSRIVRLGEGVSKTGALSEAAMERTISAIRVCAGKIHKRRATHVRCIATQACRMASNGEAFLARVMEETGLEFEIITTEEEARLAVIGCAELFDPEAPAALVFDIGGGSTEISWVRYNGDRAPKILAWTSLPLGVVSLSERWGGHGIDRHVYDEIVEDTRKQIAAAGDAAGVRNIFQRGEAHLVGTSGTVTSIAGIHLELPRYRRDAVDGLWLTDVQARAVSERLRAMSFDERANEPCIGPDRADLVVCGCAILEALLIEWPATRIRVADRGLREGLLTGLARDAKRSGSRRGRKIK